MAKIFLGCMVPRHGPVCARDPRRSGVPRSSTNKLFVCFKCSFQKELTNNPFGHGDLHCTSSTLPGSTVLHADTRPFSTNFNVIQKRPCLDKSFLDGTVFALAFLSCELITWSYHGVFSGRIDFTCCVQVGGKYAERDYMEQQCHWAHWYTYHLYSRNKDNIIKFRFLFNNWNEWHVLDFSSLTLDDCQKTEPMTLLQLLILNLIQLSLYWVRVSCSESLWFVPSNQFTSLFKNKPSCVVDSCWQCQWQSKVVNDLTKFPLSFKKPRNIL